MTRTEIEVAGMRATVIHDPLPADGSALADDIVVGPGGASQSLLRLTPRIHFKRAWDLGCGSGVQSVIAAQHCDRVVATDIDERCLEFTRQSAQASGVHVETRLGSLAEPVTGETFDLIISNPPFVIGNATELVHRESPREADALTAELLQTLPTHLVDGGLAIMLTAWLVTEHQDWQERIEEWLPADCDVWVGLRSTQPVTDYVETWLADAGRAGDTETAAEWESRLRGWGATEVAFGIIVLRKTAHVGWVRCEDLRLAGALPSGDQVLERLEAADRSEQLTAVDIMMGTFAQASSQPWRGEVSLEPVLLALRDRLNGEQSIDDICDSIARDWSIDADDVLVHALAGMKALVDLGLASEA